MSYKEYSRELTDKQFSESLKSIMGVINDDTLSDQEKVNSILKRADNIMESLSDMPQEESEAVSELFWKYGELKRYCS